MFAHRKDIIASYRKASEDGTLLTINGEIPIFKDDYIATNLCGDQLIISDEYVKNFKEIEIKNETPRKKYDSPFVTEYAKALQDGCGMEQEESEQYIKGEHLGWKLEQD